MDNFSGMWSVALDLWRAEQEGAPGLERRQKSRLAALLTYARRKSRFCSRLYRNLPSEGTELCDVPVISKHELMHAFDDWITDPRITRAGVEAFIRDPSQIATLYREKYFVSTSAGTTGLPGLFVSDLTAINIYRAIAVGRIERAWLGPADLLRMAQKGFRWAAVLGTGGHYAGAGWIELERRRDVFRAHAFRVFSVQQPLAELVAALNAFDPAMLTGYPSALELLSEEQIAGRLDLQPVLLECGGETLSHDAARQMATAFACPVRNLYSASECIPMAFSCDQDWLHVNSDWVILEPVDEHLRPVLPGSPSHTVLLTNLANWTQPLIRYDLGDSIIARCDQCPCGSPLPAIRVAGRHDDVLQLQGADERIVKILPLAIGTVIEETYGVRRSQLIQTGPATIRIRLELKDGMDREKTWHDAFANLKTYLAKQRLANVELIRANELPEHSIRSWKFRQVIADPVSLRRHKIGDRRT